MNTNLRSSIRIVIYLTAFMASTSYAQCAPWETQCVPPAFPGGDYDGEAPNGISGVFFVPNASGNPYPATCSSPRQQRILHAAYDIAARMATRTDDYSSFDEIPSYWVIYDDGGTQTYHDSNQWDGIPASPLVLDGGVYDAGSTNQINPDICDQFNPYY